MRRFTPLLIILAPALSSAITLSTPYDVGANTSFYMSPNGDTAQRLEPSIIDVTDQRTADLRDRLATDFPDLVPDPASVTIGNSLTGDVAVRNFDVGGGYDGGSGRYFVGASFQLDYVDATFAPDQRWSVIFSFAPAFSFPFSEGFANYPTYYSDARELDQHIGDTYTLDSNIYALASPGDYEYEIQAFLVSTTQNTDGTFSSITIHDGVSLKANVHEVDAPVPEPASLAVLSVGAVALLRRRRKA